MATSLSDARRSRPLRPVERQPMVEWLHEILDSGDMAGASWTCKTSGEFKIQWCHGARHGWTKKHAHVFERWAHHTGRYDSQKKDASRWKANFRCAIRSLKDVIEIKEKSVTKGTNAFRVYRFVKQEDKEHAQNASKNTKSTRKMRTKAYTVPTKPEPMTIVEDMDNEKPATAWPEEPEEFPKLAIHTNLPVAPPQELPDFEKISSGLSKVEFGRMHVLPNHGCGFTVNIGSPPKTSKPPLRDFQFIACGAATTTSTTPTTSGNSATPTILPTILPDVHSATFVDHTETIYPETPEASEGSPSSDSNVEGEQLIELYVIEENGNNLTVTETMTQVSCLEDSVMWAGQQTPLTPPYEN